MSLVACMDFIGVEAPSTPLLLLGLVRMKGQDQIEKEQRW